MGKTTEQKATNTSASDEEVALLAYSFWQQRGSPDGSPEEDWLRAEQELRPKVQAASA